MNDNVFALIGCECNTIYPSKPVVVVSRRKKSESESRVLLLLVCEGKKKIHQKIRVHSKTYSNTCG